MYALVLSFLNYKGFVILLRKWLRLKKKCGIPLVYLLVSLALKTYQLRLPLWKDHFQL